MDYSIALQIRGIIFAALALLSLAMAAYPSPCKLRYVFFETSSIFCTLTSAAFFMRSGRAPVFSDYLWLLSFGIAAVMSGIILHWMLFQSVSHALACRIELSTEEVYEGDCFTLRASLENTFRIPFHCVRLTISLPDGILFEDADKRPYTFYSEIFALAGGEKKEIRYRLHAGRRGLYTMNDITVLYRDFLVFGSSTVRFFSGVSRKNTITVYPMPLVLQKHFRTRRHVPGDIPIARSTATDPLLFSGVRAYDSDPISRINWKMSAVHRQLLVNTEEPHEKMDLTLVLNLQSRSVQRADRELSSRELSEMAIAVSAAVVDLASGDNTPLRIITNGETDFCIREDYRCGGEEHLLISGSSIRRGEYFSLLRFLARMQMKLTCSAKSMFETLSRDPSVWGGGSVVVVSPYFNATLRDFYEALQCRGIRCVFYITTLNNDFTDIPEDIPIYFRTHRGGIIMTLNGICLLCAAVLILSAFCRVFLVNSIRVSLDVPCTETDKKEQHRIRRSGMLTLCTFFLLSGFLTVLFFLILHGAWVLFRCALFFAVGEEGERFGITVLGSSAEKTWSITSVLFLLLLALAVILFFLLAEPLRRWEIIRRIQDITWRIFLFILDFLDHFLRWRKDKDPLRRRYARPADKRKTQDAWIVPYEPPKKEADTYAVFLRRLVHIPDTDRRIGYAYRTICRLYKRSGVLLKMSDTPEEIARAVRRSGKFREEETDVIRDAVETVMFREITLSEKRKNELLTVLCSAVQKYMG